MLQAARSDAPHAVKGLLWVYAYMLSIIFTPGMWASPEVDLGTVGPWEAFLWARCYRRAALDSSPLRGCGPLALPVQASQAQHPLWPANYENEYLLWRLLQAATCVSHNPAGRQRSFPLSLFLPCHDEVVPVCRQDRKESRTTLISCTVLHQLYGFTAVYEDLVQDVLVRLLRD